ncbi:MAG: TonB-dependent receptor plug domain-containing protein, partial [Sphingobium sp.]
MNHITKTMARYGAATSIMSIALMTAMPASAQSETRDAASDAAYDDSVIIVTGSRIVRPDLEASSPVTTLSPEQFKQSNSATVEKLLAQNPQFVPAIAPTVNNGNPGAATIDLRGLGDKRTLVLVNGKRQVSYDSQGAVDLNAIPVALIKRVDVLTGGASAVYGSDAVAGVVNFILDDRFTGLQADASSQITSRGDGQVYDLSLTGGLEFGGGRGNIVLS